MKPHKWAKEIKAWADGAEIVYRKIGTEKWLDEKEDFPYWDSVIFEYRIKPQPKEPKYLYVYEIDAKDIVLRTESTGEMWLIGKIKLETEDAI